MTIAHEATELVLSRDEILRRIDEGARERRGMSGEELLRAYDEGRLDEPGEVGDLLVLGDLVGHRTSEDERD